MEKEIKKMIRGYQQFREKYAGTDENLMQSLAIHGQKPKFLVIACSDSRVDPGILLQCDPGELFVVRNIANIVPPYENDEKHHGTSAALEFAICYLEIKHIIILGHSTCGGIQAKLKKFELDQDDFIGTWISQIKVKPESPHLCADEYGKQSLVASYDNCLTYPWLKERLAANKLKIHLWFLEIGQAMIESYDFDQQKFVNLAV